LILKNFKVFGISAVCRQFCRLEIETIKESIEPPKYEKKKIIKKKLI